MILSKKEDPHREARGEWGSLLSSFPQYQLGFSSSPQAQNIESVCLDESLSTGSETGQPVSFFSIVTGGLGPQVPRAAP